MKRIACGLFLVALLGAGPAFAAPAVLRQSATVEADVVKLGDLFDNVGTKAGTVVVHAPQPGRKVVLEADWLANVASAYGVEWRPLSRLERITVERRSTVVGTEEMTAELKRALSIQGMPDDADIQLVNRNLQVFLPSGGALALAVRDLDYDQRSGRFAATIEASTGGAPVLTRVAGRAFAVTEVPVLKRAVDKGDIVTDADVEWKPMREEQVQRGVLSEREQVVGQQARHALRPGQPLRSGDVREPVLVAKGSVVTMVLRNGAMSLSAQGRATEDGGLGQTIRVTNTSSKLTVEAKVEGSGVVSVMPAGRVLVN